MRIHQRLRYPLGVVALGVGVFALQPVLGLLVYNAVALGFPSWLPTFGPVGRTVTVYLWGQRLFAQLFVPVAAFWLGVRYARTDPDPER